uniref:Bone morphogenetic protein 2-like n=1 Tax=Mastacembelus armatus TaxID=205130 RepID=A0A3Q3RL08_9TELE
MTAGALRLGLVFALQLRCVTLLAVPQDRGTTGLQDGLNAAKTVREKVDALIHLTDLPRGPAVAPHKKAPQFMLDLFNAVSVSDGTPRNQKEILEGNIVRSFEDKGEQKVKLILKNYCCFFYLGNDLSVQVDLYEVLDSRVKPWRGNLINSKLVPLYTRGWEVFNVTQMVMAVLTLLFSKEISFSFYILIVICFSGGLGYTNAYLVIFSDDDRTRATNQSYLGKTRVAVPVSPESQDHRSRRRRASPGPSRHDHPQSCQRVPLFVDFEEIGWSGWIISPRGYNAYHCKGSCPFPLGGSLRATNHATVRSIMHALKISSDDVGAPCCVPDRLQSISLLYFDDEENVVLKQYDDMVALSCGCH